MFFYESFCYRTQRFTYNWQAIQNRKHAETFFKFTINFIMCTCINKKILKVDF